MHFEEWMEVEDEMLNISMSDSLINGFELKGKLLESRE